MKFSLTLPYGKVKQASFSLESGECVLLAGPNGCGKTTLLKAMAKNPECVLIPTHIPKVKGFTLTEFIKSGCYLTAPYKLEEHLEMLGLKDLSSRDISTLSDGEFQKVCIALGLCRRARVLLLDEPTAFLDVENKAMVLKALSGVAARTGISILFSSHDIHDSLAVARRVLVFTKENCLEMSKIDEAQNLIEKSFYICI